MRVTVHDRVVLFVGDNVGSVPIENHDTTELVRFLEALKRVPIWYNIAEGVIERSIYDFRKVAGNIGYVRYKEVSPKLSYYFAKGIIYKQPALILQVISTYLPCTRVIMYGETTVDDLIDLVIERLKAC